MLPIGRVFVSMTIRQVPRNLLSGCQEHHQRLALKHMIPLSHQVKHFSSVLRSEGPAASFATTKSSSLLYSAKRTLLPGPVTNQRLQGLVSPGLLGCSVRHKNSNAWSEKPVVFRSTSPPASDSKQPRSERASSKKVSKVPRPRTRKPSRLKGEEKDAYLCTAFATAEEYNLEHLSFDLQIQGNMFCLAAMPQDAHDILHVHLSDEYYEGQAVDEPGQMFFFEEGSVVFWNVPDPVIKQVIRIVGRHQLQPYEVALVNWENEQMNYSYHDQKTSLIGGNVMLDTSKPSETTALEKFAFSNAMALSVKLAMWEYSLDQFANSIENIPENMKLGKGIKLSREEVMRKTGELFALRHRINLSSDLLISPDFYWDREELELIYSKMCQFLSISRRTNVMNEKLAHCSELVELMRTHLEERHSHLLEWLIIALIMVEVFFEIIHYIRIYRAEEDEKVASRR